MSKKYLYKFLLTGLKSNYDKSQWKVGKWREVEPPKNECKGLNASEYIQHSLGYVQRPILAKVECGGKIIKGDDKWTCEKMRIISTAKWNKNHSVMMAVFAAELCIGNFEKIYPSNDSPRKAIEAAKKWLASSTARAARAASNAAFSEASAASAADKAIHKYILSIVKWEEERDDK